MKPITLSAQEIQENPFLRCRCGAILARRLLHNEGHETLHPVSLVKLSFQLTTPYESSGECRHCTQRYTLLLPRS